MELTKTNKYNDKIYLPVIWVLSVAVPLVVGILMTPGLIPQIDMGFDPYILPKVYSTINALVACLLIAGFWAIKNRKINIHRNIMLTAFGLSALFLVLYVLFHLSAGSTPYCEEGLVPKPLYLFVLLTHILLSATIIPLASFSIYRGLSEKYDKHRKLAKITFPLWLYVAITGPLIYFMIPPCY